jgi:hypothetical protein
MAKKSKKGNIMNSLTDVAALTVGAAVAAKVANIKLPVPNAVKPALPILLGLFLMKKGGFVGGVGAGMIASGGVKFIGAVAPNLGINQDMEDISEDISEYVIEGAEDYALAGANENVSGYAGSYALAGMDEDSNPDFAG